MSGRLGPSKHNPPYKEDMTPQPPPVSDADEIADLRAQIMSLELQIEADSEEQNDRWEEAVAIILGESEGPRRAKLFRDDGRVLKTLRQKFTLIKL